MARAVLAEESGEDLAAVLKISTRTVAFHKYRLMESLGIRARGFKVVEKRNRHSGGEAK